MLRINPNGTKAWYVQLDRTRKRKISDAGLLSASVARYRARDMLVRQAMTDGAAKTGPGKRTLGAFLLDNYAGERGRAGTYLERDTRRLCSALGTLADERLEFVGVSKLEQWKLKRSQRVKPATLNREIAMLKAAFRRARRQGFLVDNPARAIRLRQDSSQGIPRVLTDPERSRLDQALSRSNDRFGTLVRLALNTGMRRNELFGLRWKDVYFGPYPSIIVEKPAAKHHNRGRRIPLNKEAETALMQWQAARANRNYLVFPGPSGGQLKNVNHAWQRLMAAANIRNFRLNDCRHDFAARLTRAGVPLSQVRDLLGHSSLALTEKYGCFAPGNAVDAVSLLDRKPDSIAEGPQRQQPRP